MVEMLRKESCTGVSKYSLSIIVVSSSETKKYLTLFTVMKLQLQRKLFK